jgi:hypothetical protein
VHPKTVDAPHLRTFLRLARDDDQSAVARHQFVDDERARHVQRVGGGGLRLLRPGRRPSLSVAIGRDLDVELFNHDSRDMSPEQANDVSFGGEALDRDHRRDITPTFMTDGESVALRAKLGKHAESKVGQLDLGIEARSQNINELATSGF